MRTMRTLLAWLMALVPTALLLGSCRDDGPTGPTVKPPYLALVSLFAEQPEPDVEANFGYRVQDIGGTTTLDTIIRATTADTVILPLSISTYRVTLVGLPSRCFSREGMQLSVPLANIKGFNTNIARYHISCQTALNVIAYSFGPNDDNQFIYTLQRDGGPEELGALPSDTARYFVSLEPGWYTLTLGHVSDLCTPISDGGLRQRFEIPPTGGVSRIFSLSCSDPARRPKMVSVRGSFHDGAVAVIMRATDPDKDVRKFYWAVTNCAGTIAWSRGIVENLNPLPQDRFWVDTVTFIGARELDSPDINLEGHCVAARISDFLGNTTPWVEYPLHSTGASGSPPVADNFNTIVISQQVNRVTLQASDLDNDLVGTVAARRVRDGVIFTPPNGKDDFLYAHDPGYLSTTIPDLPLRQWDSRYPGHLDVNAVVVYLIDAAGNFSRHIDEDTFR